MGSMKGFIGFLRAEKLWWIVPLVIVVILISVVFFLETGETVSTFAYDIR